MLTNAFKCNKQCEILLQFKITLWFNIFLNVIFIPVMQLITSVFSVTLSIRNHSNADLLLKKHFLLSMLKTLIIRKKN